HLYRGRIDGLRDRGTEAIVDRLREALCGGEVRRVQVQQHSRLLIEIAGRLTLDRRAVRNASRAHDVHADARAVLALRAEAADDEIALRDRIDLAVGATERRHQQAASAQTL